MQEDKIEKKADFHLGEWRFPHSLDYGGGGGRFSAAGRAAAARGFMTNRTRISARCARFLGASFAIAATKGISVGAVADEASEIRAGQDLATKLCSPCHGIAERPGPPLAEIAKGEHVAPDALRALLHSTQSNVSHPNAMPNPELTERQIEEISAYLGSLRATK